MKPFYILTEVHGPGWSVAWLKWPTCPDSLSSPEFPDCPRLKQDENRLYRIDMFRVRLTLNTDSSTCSVLRLTRHTTLLVWRWSSDFILTA